MHLTGWLRNWQAFDSTVTMTIWLKPWYTRNSEEKWAHPQHGPSLPKSNHKGTADWSTETILNLQDQHRFRQLFNRYQNLKRINPAFSLVVKQQSMVMAKCWCKENARELCLDWRLGHREGLWHWTKESKAALLPLFSFHTEREEQQLSTSQNGCQ